MEQFASESFDAQQYVSLITNTSVSLDQLHEQSRLVHLTQILYVKQLHHKAAQDLKSNVYKNYQSYIDASAEITKLEAEMDRLNKGLDEEQGILLGLDTLFRTKLPPGVEPQMDEGSRVQQIKSLDRGNPLLAGDCLHQGRMTVLDAETHAVTGQAHVLLLKNSLVVAMFSSGSQLKPWSAMDSMTLEMVDPLSTLTVGDCHDIKNGILINGIKSAQILVCQSARDKLGWMSALRKIEVHFQEIEGDDDSAAVEGHQERTDWLYEVPEEMDVCIAQRNFEGAVKFATRARAEFEGSKALSGMVSLQRRIDEKVDKLTAALCSELRRPAIRTHAIRATVGFLLDLGKADLAHEVYLLNRSQRLKQKFRKVKMEGSTELYALKLSGTFFSTIRSTCVEYAEYFDESASSAFVSWASKELRRFASNFTHQVLQSLNKLQTVAQCVQKVMQQCGQLSDCGLDLSFVLWEMLETKTLEAINDAGQALLNTTSIDLDVEDWQAQEFAGNKYALKQLLEKMSHHQFEIGTYIQKKRCSLFEVTTNCIGRVHEYVSAVLCLINLRLDDALLPWLVEVFGTIVKWLTRRADGSTIFQENMDALLTLLRQSRRRVEDVTGRECDILVGLEGDILSTWAHGSHTGSIV